MLDEATASIDRDTDRLIQSMIRDSFEGVTTMVIAHRLNTIMDFDRILVFDEGRVVEFDTVSENIWQLCTNTFCPLLSCFFKIHTLIEIFSLFFGTFQNIFSP